MAAMTGATVIWWVSLAGGEPASTMTVLALAMVAATGLASAGARRALRESARFAAGR